MCGGIWFQILGPQTEKARFPNWVRVRTTKAALVVKLRYELREVIRREGDGREKGKKWKVRGEEKLGSEGETGGRVIPTAKSCVLYSS